ncbi:MAG: glucans biosynthesis glucosyltransferase MdoH [Alphaproteobacteria bacterium]|nr:glucans biosynthesis glucosyltransferase MdoH [Alphaproteobacteria bacterium]
MGRVQSLIDAPVGVRRLVFLGLVASTEAGLLALAALTLSVLGFALGDLTMLVLFALTTPWLVVGFWNAAIGLLLMSGKRDPSEVLIPEAARRRELASITASTAILMCVRNESSERVVGNLDTMIADLLATRQAAHFHVYILSDTNRAEVAAAEQQAFDDLSRKWAGRLPVTYRRRAVNTGFKAGNIGDFLNRWGDRHELMVTLDADSLMTAAGILRLVDIMQRRPSLGILQSLVIGMPTTSAFARLFQFGMRLGLRSWTIGSAWWQADCGPYWGHNAIIRVAPFKQHCALPPLVGKGMLSGHILSHDQLEAALMRRAGYEVRVLPEEDLGWEENPPTLIEFLRRDQRWLQGTLQYVFFIGLPGLKPVSRIQLLFALLMFAGSPAWIGLGLLGTFTLASVPNPAALIDPRYGTALLTVVLVMWFAPKVATVIDVLSRSSLRQGFGGAWRFIASVLAETIFSLLLSPIMWVCHTMSLLGLLVGRVVGWSGQMRDDHTVGWRTAVGKLWPQTLLGGVIVTALALWQPVALPHMLVLMAAGLVLAVPLCVVTSWPSVGLALKALGIGRLPEETAPPAALSRPVSPLSKASDAVSAD